MHRKSHRLLVVCLWLVLLLTACREQESPSSNVSEGSADHTPAVARRADTHTPALAIALDPAQGQEIGSVYEAYLSPHQEPGEEKDTPSHIPAAFRSTTPSLLREERPGRGHAFLRFTKDLSRVYVDIGLENIVAETVVMFHIHCGRPDMLGPIIVDFGLIDDIQANMADGIYSVTVTNADIEATTASGHGLVGVLTMGCPIPPSLSFQPGSVDKVKTIAGMEYLAQQGDLYFNLHTSGQVYYGDIRGQIYPITPFE